MKELLANLARALDHVQIPYCVIGGQAVLVHGEPRFTRDIDLTLAAGTDRLPDVLTLAGARGWRVLPQDPVSFVARHLVLPRDIEDASSVVRKHPDLDWAYVSHWLEQFDRNLGLQTTAALQSIRQR